MSPLVTIITPCYNGEAFLDKYFASILAQTYDRLELIFVNDGSTDRTEEIALSYRQALEDRGIVFKYLYQPKFRIAFPWGSQTYLLLFQLD